MTDKSKYSPESVMPEMTTLGLLKWKADLLHIVAKIDEEIERRAQLV